MKVKNLVRNARFERITKGAVTLDTLTLSMDPYPEVEIVFDGHRPDSGSCRVLLETSKKSGVTSMTSCCGPISGKPLEGAGIYEELFKLTDGDGPVRVQLTGELAYEGALEGADRRLGSKPHGRYVLYVVECIIFTIGTR
ncbi:MAG: hypothetical protein PHW53_02165 [Patescibacteria group bacterium]|nr:hypothetical protein [Patescibacteria group bacterium]